MQTCSLCLPFSIHSESIDSRSVVGVFEKVLPKFYSSCQQVASYIHHTNQFHSKRHLDGQTCRKDLQKGGGPSWVVSLMSRFVPTEKHICYTILVCQYMVQACSLYIPTHTRWDGSSDVTRLWFPHLTNLWFSPVHKRTT